MWQIITILTLLGLMILRQTFDLRETVGTLDPNSLAAIGFIILAAFTTGELFRRIKMPALLGYIVAGIIFGPELTRFVLGTTEPAIFGHDVIGDLSLIHVLIVGVIGTLGGGELKIAELKSQAGTILTVLPMCFLAAVPLSGLVAFGLSIFFPSMIPFVADLPQAHKIAMALLFGVFGFAMSPTVTLAIMQETRSKGPFTSLTLAVVIAAELVLVASFLIMLKFAELLVSPDGFSTALMAAEIPGIAAEFGWAIVVGIATGIVFILYLRFVAREMLLFTVGIIFAASAVSDMLHAEGLLVFLVAGFVVQNFSRHGHDMIHALEKISLPVFVIYFMTEAATLDLTAVGQYLPLALVLTATRATALAGATKLATKLRGDPDYIDSNLWLAFFPLGSVDIVLAGMVATSIEPWGEELRGVIIAVVVLHMLTVPIVLKWVLGRVGETEEARKAGSEQVAKLDRIVGYDEEPTYEPLEQPKFPDEKLNDRLQQIHDKVSRAYEQSLVEHIENHGRRLHHLIDRTQTLRSEALDDLVELIEQSEGTPSLELVERIKRLHMNFRRALQPQIDMLEHLEPIPVSTEQTDQLLGELRGLVDFEEHHRVKFEDRLLEATWEDAGPLALVKAARRVRARLFGRTWRNVPLGILWRYYMELSVPGYLASAVSAATRQNETFWNHLGIHLRRIDQLFELVVLELRDEALSSQPDPELDGLDLIDADDMLAPSLDALPMSMSTGDQRASADGEQPDQHGEHPADEPLISEIDSQKDSEQSSEDDAEDSSEEDSAQADEPTEAEAALALVRARRDELDEESEELGSLLSVFVSTLRERFSFSIESAYSDFMEGVATSGTIELPPFRYRPSSRYDDARRAEDRLHQRLERGTDIAAGYQGWILVDHQLVVFLHWFRTYQQRILSTLESRFEQTCVDQLQELKRVCEQALGRDGQDEQDGQDGQDGEDGEDIDWKRRFEEEFDPLLDETRSTLEQALSDFGQGIITRRLMDVLEAHVARFSREVKLLGQSPVEAVDQAAGVETVNVAVRSWYFSKLLRETALRLVEFNERGERVLRRSWVALGDIRQGLEATLLPAHERHEAAASATEAPAQNAEDALLRAAKGVDDLIDSIRRDQREISVWITHELTRVMRESAAPFLEHRLADIRRELSTRRSSLARRSVQPILSRLKSVYRGFEPIFEDIADEVRDRLTGEPELPQPAAVRERLTRGERAEAFRAPATYRRIFSPVPVDIPDFYIERAELEGECADAVDRWLSTRASSLLIVGDRGMGKRSLVHHVLPSRLFGRYNLHEGQLQTVRIDEYVETERDLCASLAPLVDDQHLAPQTLAELGQRLENADQRQIVFVENGDKLYSRTRDGLSLCERFLNTVEATSDHTLWIVLMSCAATTVLDTAIGLRDYFTHVLELDRMDPEQIEHMVMLRHEASGFDLEFLRPDVSYLDRLQSPIDTTEMLRNPRNAYFERLSHLSKGNPLLVLLYWLESIHVDPKRSSCIVVDPLPEQELALTANLSLRKKLILATLVQHHALSTTRLSRILRVGLAEVRSELNHLCRLGFVEQIAGTSSYRLRPLPAVLVTHELRAQNLV